jgi:hypothetical protein
MLEINFKNVKYYNIIHKFIQINNHIIPEQKVQWIWCDVLVSRYTKIMRVTPAGHSNANDMG